MAQAKKEVAVKEASKPLAIADDLYAQYAGAGQENVTAQDMVIPELRVLQKNVAASGPRRRCLCCGCAAGYVL